MSFGVFVAISIGFVLLGLPLARYSSWMHRMSHERRLWHVEAIECPSRLGHDDGHKDVHIERAVAANYRFVVLAHLFTLAFLVVPFMFSGYTLRGYGIIADLFVLSAYMTMIFWIRQDFRKADDARVRARIVQSYPYLIN